MGFPEDELPPNPDGVGGYNQGPPPGGYNQGGGGVGYDNRGRDIGYSPDQPAYRGQGMPRSLQEKRAPYQANKDMTECIKYVMFAYNLMFFICGCVLLGLGIWMAVDRSFMATITGEPLYAVAIYMVLAGGALIFIISFLGCAGAIWENKLMITIFLIVQIVIVVILFLGAILAIVFRTQVGEAVRETMKDTLTTYYGVDLYERKNHAVTDAWDRAQERVRDLARTYLGI
jgi:hypothetical protein